MSDHCKWCGMHGHAAKNWNANECLIEVQSQLAAAQAEIVRLSGKTGFCLECEEQARLLGMSGSREAKLIAELAATKAKLLGREKLYKEEWERANNAESQTQRLAQALEKIVQDKTHACAIARAALDGAK